MSVVGVDYSLSSPAVWTEYGGHYLTNTAKYAKQYLSSSICGEKHKPHESQMQRYCNIAQWVIECIRKSNSHFVMIEDYSFSSTGRVFHIAENCAILKYYLWKNYIPFDTVPPTVIKKFATGKGNANKEKMYEAYVKETDTKLHDIITPDKSNLSNPVTDLVDAYFIQKYAKQEISL